MFFSPLLHDGWLEFNRRKWNLQPLRMRFAGEGSNLPAIEVAYYLDRRGRIRSAPLHPYLPVFFEPTPVQSSRKRGLQWLKVAGQLVADMERRKLAHRICLPPSVTDVRPWQWAGFEVSVRYTFCVGLPLDEHEIDREAKRVVDRATAAGFRACATTQMEDVSVCLKDTEDRKGISYGLTREDIELARQLIGPEHFRCYACYSSDGEPAASMAVLHVAGACAVDTLAGTRQAHLRSGATQLLTRFCLDDLFAAGATGMDYAGANIPSVAAAKAAWGGQLLPTFVIKPKGLRGLADFAYRSAHKWWASRRRPSPT